MEIALIVAVADNGVIGVGGGLPWRLPADMRRFRQTTMGHHVVMGRLTWMSLGKPLTGRTNVVVSRDASLQTAAAAQREGGITVVPSLAAAIELAAAAGERELFVIGGAGLYREALPLADRIYLTRVRVSPDGDTFFPALDPAQWTEVACEQPPEASTSDIAFEFVVLQRRLPSDRAPSLG
jgi:dihydrofolate reductase